MRAVYVTFVVRDKFEEEQIIKDLENLMSRWPTFGWTYDDATEDQIEWFNDEYGDDDE